MYRWACVLTGALSLSVSLLNEGHKSQMPSENAALSPGPRTLELAHPPPIPVPRISETLGFGPAGAQPRKGREGRREENSFLFIRAQSPLPFWGKNALFFDSYFII